MILKYFNGGDVVVTDITSKDMQQLCDDYFDAAQAHYNHDSMKDLDRERTRSEIAIHNSFVKGFSTYNEVLVALASIHLLRKEKPSVKQKD